MCRDTINVEQEDCNIIQVIIGGTGIVTKGLRKNLEYTLIKSLTALCLTVFYLYFISCNSIYPINMVCFGYIIANTLHKGNNKDDDDGGSGGGGGGG